MKILSISLLMAGLLIIFSLGMDLLQGFDINTSLRNAFSPFRVMEAPELAILSFFIILLVIESVLSFIKKRGLMKQGDGSSASSPENKKT